MDHCLSAMYPNTNAWMTSAAFQHSSELAWSYSFRSSFESSSMQSIQCARVSRVFFPKSVRGRSISSPVQSSDSKITWLSVDSKCTEPPQDLKHNNLCQPRLLLLALCVAVLCIAALATHLERFLAVAGSFATVAADQSNLRHAWLCARANLRQIWAWRRLHCAPSRPQLVHPMMAPMSGVGKEVVLAPGGWRKWGKG